MTAVVMAAALEQLGGIEDVEIDVESAEDVEGFVEVEDFVDVESVEDVEGFVEVEDFVDVESVEEVDDFVDAERVEDVVRQEHALEILEGLHSCGT